MNKKTIIGLGEILYDIPLSRLHMSLGGAPANALFVAQQLGTNVNGALISRVGDDLLGENARQALDQVGISTEGLQIDASARTGTVTVLPGEKGETYLIKPNVAYDNLAAEPQAIRLMQTADVVIFGSLALRGVRNCETYEQLFANVPPTADLFCDINLREHCYTPAAIKWCLEHATTFKLNEQEVLKISDMGLGLPPQSNRFSQDLFQEFPNIRTCIITRGADGAIVSTQQGLTFACKGISLRPGEFVDTVGCGDAFSGAFAVARLQGYDLHAAATLANSAGAYAATKPGGMYQVDTSTLLDFAAGHRPSLNLGELLGTGHARHTEMPYHI